MGFQRLAGAGRTLWEIPRLQHTERWKGLWPQVNCKQSYTSAAFYVSPFKRHNCFKQPLGCMLGSNFGHYAQIVNQMPQPCYSQHVFSHNYFFGKDNTTTESPSGHNTNTTRLFFPKRWFLFDSFQCRITPNQKKSFKSKDTGMFCKHPSFNGPVLWEQH